MDPAHPALAPPTSQDPVTFEPLPAAQLAGGAGEVGRSSLVFTDTLGRGWFGWVVSGCLAGRGRVVVKILREEAESADLHRFRGEHTVQCL